MASAQDGGLGGAVPPLGERAPARRAGAVREAGDAAPPDPGPGEPDWGGPECGGPFLEFREGRRRAGVLGRSTSGC